MIYFEPVHSFPGVVNIKDLQPVGGKNLSYIMSLRLNLRLNFLL
jgi:hypothetical protein